MEEQKNGIKDETKILIMLAFFSISMGLWNNFRQLWLQSNNMNVSEFCERFQLQLNPQQAAAVERTEGPVLLLAVPGSGKTTVLVSRLGYMIWAREIPPQRILTVTYTVAATQDMKRRFAQRFGEDAAQLLTFRTINGICAVVIQRYAVWKGTQPFRLVNDERQLNALVRELLARGGVPFPGELQIKEARTHITYCKNMMLTEEQVGEHTVDGMNFPAVYRGYQNYLREHRLMDYDEQMVKPGFVPVDPEDQPF